jgi:hypothetical protein
MPLRRVLIEEIGVEEDKATSNFRKKVEMESTNVDKPDLFNVSHNTESQTVIANSHGDGATVQRVMENCPENDCSSSISLTADQGDEKQHVGPLPNPSNSAKVTEPMSSASLERAVPTSSFQFQADWKILKHRREDFYHYFKVSYV